MATAINQKKQILVLGGLVFIITLAYFVVRYLPAHSELTQLSNQLKADKAELANPRYPEVPDEEVDELQDMADKLVAQVLAMETAMKGYLDALEGDNDQDIILRVSEIARNSNVKVTENVPFIVPKAQTAAQKNNQPQTSLSQATTKGERKKIRRERRAATAGSVGTPQTSLGEPEGTLIYQLVNDFPEPRPMQAMTLEGNFFDLKSFLQALGSMPVQVTVVRMDVTTKTDVMMQGMPQVLLVKMILAM
jgi:hypothetical protein